MIQSGFDLKNTKIAIVGLGLMGGSLALALKGKCAALYGIDSDPAILKLALDEKVVDKAHSDPSRLLPQADVIVLATPIPALLNWIRQLPLLVQSACLILDLGSTKAEIVTAMDKLPEHFEALGGHPICGKEKSSLKNADGNLYQNAPFVLTALSRTTPRARAAGEQMVRAVCARPVWMEALEHDRVLAFLSHLPFLIASALVLTVPDGASTLAGPGFRTVTRLAETPSSTMLGVLQSNRQNVLDALCHFRVQLSLFEDALSSGLDGVMASDLEKARALYHTIIPPLL